MPKFTVIISFYSINFIPFNWRNKKKWKLLNFFVEEWMGWMVSFVFNSAQQKLASLVWVIGWPPAPPFILLHSSISFIYSSFTSLIPSLILYCVCCLSFLLLMNLIESIELVGWLNWLSWKPITHCSGIKEMKFLYWAANQ